ncbi:phosphonate C-P lyase system protein PhnH [Microbacterium sp. A84]|uniref:phosphonate C-P lyase system protein PhnH n=1 Tax=Microbacterium sp. A84 TaxID=3450715 RepID=UPI003F4356D9
MNVTAIQTPGLADPVNDAQRIFRAALAALARPTLAQPVRAGMVPPAPLSPTVGALVLTLCDEQTPIWLDPALRGTGDVETWIRFHTGARIVEDAHDALFCVASGPSAVPSLSDLRQGSDEEPHLSATVIIDAAGAESTGSFVASGPGINGEVCWDGAGLPASSPERPGFLETWDANTRRYPRGVDLILAGEDEVRGLPRTTALKESR